MAFTWNLEGRWKDGRPNAHELARASKLSYPVAVRVLANEPMARVDSVTLSRLAAYFGVKSEKDRLSLVRHTADAE